MRRLELVTHKQKKNGYPGMRVPWIVLVILHISLAQPKETPDFSCYFSNWYHGSCKFPWDGQTNFTQCRVLFTLMKLHSDEENMKIICDINTCSIAIDFSFESDYKYYTWATINICIDEEEYFDTKSFRFERREVTKADSPEKIRTEQVTSTKAILKWTTAEYSVDFDYDVMAVVFPSNKDSSKFYSGEHVYRTVYKSRNLEGSIMIENLTYSDHNYTVRLSQKFTSAPDVEKFWSNDVVYVFKTKPSRPRKSPRTTLGAFYANRNNVRIFWEQLEQKYWSGPNFTYSVSLCDNYQIPEDKLTRQISWTNEIDGTRSTTSTLRAPDGDFEICLRSANSFGLSDSVSKIKIQNSDNQYSPIGTVKKILTNNTYDIVWSVSPEENRDDITGFKIFTCKVRSFETEICRTSIVKVYEVSKQHYRFSYKSADILAFAVSPIYGDQSPGMTWAQRRSELQDILIRGVEPVNATCIKILWSPLKKSLDDLKTKISLIHLDLEKHVETFTIFKGNSKFEEEGIYSSEISGLLPKSSITIRYDDYRVSVTSCPNPVKFYINRDITGAEIFFEPSPNLWRIQLNGTIIEDTNSTRLFLENLSPYTTYFLEVESYTMQRGKKYCQVFESKFFKTKSGEPGDVVAKIKNDGISLNVACESDGNVNDDTMYEMRLIVKINGAEGNSSKITSKECKFRIPYVCGINVIGYEYSVRAINDVDGNIDEGFPGRWSSSFFNLNDLCQRREFFAKIFIISIIGIAIVFLMLYLGIVKYYNLKEMNELKVDIPTALTEAPDESQKNGPINTAKVEEIVETVPLLVLNKIKSTAEIQETILPIIPLNISIQENSGENSEVDSISVHEEVVNAEIHRDIHTNIDSNTSYTSLQAMIPAKSPEIHAPNSSAYCTLANLKMLPSPIKGPPTEDAPPIFSGYVARQGFRF